MSQNKGSIRGQIIDSVSQKPVSFAIIAMQRPDQEFPASTLSSDSGMFRISDLDSGAYKLMITLLGYQSITRENIMISGNELDLGKISFAHDAHYLEATTITAQQEIVENTADGLVYHADKDVTTEGSTAIDVLKKVPGVSVDLDGNIELMGSSGMRIFINGKPSVLMASHPVDVLSAIPASQIKSIEVITNPSAKYDAQGTGGIINIVLRKELLPGFAGNISGTVGTRIEQGNALLSYEHEDISISADLGGNYYLPQDGTTTYTRDAVVNDTTTTLYQSGTTNTSRANFYPSLEFGWELGDNDEISASIGYEDFSHIGSYDMNIDEYSSAGNDSLLLLKSQTSRTHQTSIEWSADYTHTFDTLGTELDISYEFSGDRDSTDYRDDQSIVRAMMPVDSSEYIFGDRINELGTEAEHLFRADLTLPFDEDHSLEAGLKLNIYDVTSNYSYFNRDVNDQFVYDSTQSNNFISKQNVYAAYVIYQFKAGKFTVKPGVRYEQTISDNHLADSDEHFKRNYGTLAPSLAIFRKIGRNSFRLNYSRRIERPEYDDMNPFVNTSDRFNIITGNPYLVPEEQHRVDISYSCFFKNGLSINSSAFIRRQTKDIQNYTTYYPLYILNGDSFTDVAVLVPQNLVTRLGYGGNVFLSWSYKDKFSLRSNLSCSEDLLDNTADTLGTIVHAFRYTANLNFSINLPWNITAELFGMYYSPRRSLQSYRPAYYEYSFGMKKVFAHNRASIGFSATDWLQRDFVMKSRSTGDAYTSRGETRTPMRSFGLTFMWRFGQMREDDQADENSGNPLFQK